MPLTDHDGRDRLAARGFSVDDGAMPSGLATGTTRLRPSRVNREKGDRAVARTRADEQHADRPRLGRRKLDSSLKRNGRSGGIRTHDP